MNEKEMTYQLIKLIADEHGLFTLLCHINDDATKESVLCLLSDKEITLDNMIKLNDTLARVQKKEAIQLLSSIHRLMGACGSLAKSTQDKLLSNKPSEKDVETMENRVFLNKIICEIYSFLEDANLYLDCLHDMVKAGGVLYE